MRKTIAIVLLAVLICSISVSALSFTRTPKADAASLGLPGLKPVTLDIGKKLFADRFRDLRAPRVRIPVEHCVKAATPETFNSLVLESSLPVVVDFWAPWCGWCTRFKPAFDQACGEYKDRVNFVTYNTDLDEGVWERYAIRGIPIQIMFNDGAEVARHEGYFAIDLFRGWLNGVLRSL
ncbi:MAG: thioredoxin family protein [Nanoarchaeota archaeon]|nr:thioredoxin family protein [Nanoarchaeota archaeon]